MRFTHRLLHWLTRRFRPTRPIRRRTLLRLDLLENRNVPSTFAVTKHLDTNVAGTLRWAIQQSNAATTSPNIITIDQSAIGQLNLTAATPTITQAVTIDNTSGGSFTINGRNLYQILTVAAPVTLDKIAPDEGDRHGWRRHRCDQERGHHP